jgi:hypothetical protein
MLANVDLADCGGSYERHAVSTQRIIDRLKNCSFAGESALSASYCGGLYGPRSRSATLLMRLTLSPKFVTV